MNEMKSNQAAAVATAGTPPERVARPRRRASVEIKESLLMALDSVSAHKLRSGLTLLGVLIGVFSILAVMTAIRVLQSSIESNLSQLGPNSFSIQKFPGIMMEGPEGWQRIQRRKDISLDQGLKLKDRATLPLSVGLETRFSSAEARSRYAKTNPNVSLIGVTPESFAAKNWEIDLGRAIAGPDLDGARLVTVLGNSLAEKLFPRGSPVGQKVRFHGIFYQVIGVLESKGSAFGGDQDNFMAIPLTTGLNRYGARWRSLTILVQAPGQIHFDDTVEQVRGILRTIRKVPPGEEDDFDVVSNDSLISQFRAVTLAVRAGAAVISSIALLAAGVGIMNIMLVSVTERTREIGIRRAIGARKRSILVQFLLEAVVLCQIGGVAGVLLGVLAGNTVAYLMKVTVVIPVDWALLGMLVCSGVGVLFGTYPAIKAANLDPIDSLRYE